MCVFILCLTLEVKRLLPSELAHLKSVTEFELFDRGVCFNFNDTSFRRISDAVDTSESTTETREEVVYADLFIAWGEVHVIYARSTTVLRTVSA